VLGLEALDPLDADPGAAERGEIIHAALDRFVKAYPDRLPPDALERLLAIGHAVFAPLMSRPDVASFWWPRFQRIAGWFVATEVGRRPTVERVETEQRGSIKINAPAGPVSLKAFADRIDRRVGGGYAIVDYKTGGVPHPREVLSGLSPQLPLEAVIVEAGGFPALPANACEGLEYWQLSGGEPAGRIIPVNADIAETTATARAGLEAILAAFDDPATPYLAVPDPDLAPRYNDYAHLERLAEWASIVGGEE
jgi:ATP-dependent helicase/nuclease subunit B